MNPQSKTHLTIKDVSLLETDLPNSFSPSFYYIFNKDYRVPKSSIYLLLKYNDFFPKLLSYTKYFKLKEELFFLTYDSLVSKYMVEISLNMVDSGVEIHFQGISTKMVEVISLFLDFLFIESDDRRSALVESQIKKNLTRDKFAQSYKRLFQKLKTLYIDGYPLAEDLLKSSYNEDINITEFTYELCVVGNIKEEEARMIEENIKFKKTDSNDKQKEILLHDNLFKVPTFDISNNACGLFFPTNKASYFSMKSLSFFVVSTLKEMFFDQLRTNEEFGYVVTANTYSIKDQDFIYFVVQSEKPIDEIRERIYKFIEFGKDYIKNMDEEEFLERKESLIDSYEETHKNLNSYSYFLYSKYTNGVKGLTYKEKMVECIEKMTLRQLKESNLLKGEIVIETVK